MASDVTFKPSDDGTNSASLDPPTPPLGTCYLNKNFTHNVPLIDLCLKIYFHNVSGISSQSQIISLLAALMLCPYDIIILVETWLSSSIKSSEIFDENLYTVFRCDRADIGDTRKGGGVLIAVKSNYVALLHTTNNILEQIWVQVKLGERSLHIGATYIPPNAPYEAYEHVVSTTNKIIDDADPADIVMLFGDFNKVATWYHDTENNLLLRHGEAHEDTIAFFDAMNDLGLSQICNIRNRNQLDLIFTDLSSDFMVSRASHPLKIDSFHHASIEVVLEMKTQFDVCSPDDINTKYDFYKTNLPALSTALNNINWDDALDGLDVDDAVARFQSIIWTTLTKFTPKKCTTRKRYSCPWMNKNLASCRNRRNRAFKAVSRYATEENIRRFLMYRDQFLMLNAELYRTYLQDQAELLRRDPAKFWKIVNSKRSTGGIPRYMRFNGMESSNPGNTANLFADYFEGVYTSTDSYRVPHGPSLHPVSLLNLNINDVRKSLNEIDITKGPGPDGIPNLILKAMANELALPLTRLFNTSLTAGKFPDVWKKSYVTPIHKSGDRSDCSNYRSISILSAIPKLFEKLVTNHLDGEIGHFIHSSQHGFRPGLSTATNLTIYVDDVLNGMNRCGQVDAIYTDFAKAFDRVNHKLLIRKLQLLGIDGSLLRWLNSYLTNRGQIIRIGGAESREINTPSGVPQGSHLGPLLFAIFVNDLCDDICDSNFLLYADDLKIYRLIRNEYDAECLERDAQRVQDWCIRNNMSLNVNKCVAITFTRKKQCNVVQHDYGIGGELLNKVPVVKDLGVLIDERLTFSAHIDQIVSRGKSTLGFLKRQAKVYNCPYVTKSLYCALVRPILEYCSVVWDPVFDNAKKRLESVQKQFLLFALRELAWRDRFVLPPYEARLSLIDLESLSDRRKIAACAMATSCLNGTCMSRRLKDEFVLQPPPARLSHLGPRLKLPPMVRAIYVDNSPIRRSIYHFNSMAGCFSAGTSTNAYRAKARKELLSQRQLRLRDRCL